MPYSSVSEVPETVPAEHRKQWMEVWNSAYERARKDGQSEKDAESSAFAQANGVIKKAAGKLSEVRDGLVRVAVAYTGDFDYDGKKFSITAQDLEEMARNLSAREVPLDYEHLSAAAGAPPGYTRAAGWLKTADKIEDFSEGRKILWAWAEFTAACLSSIRQKEFRYFSPEIKWNSKDESGAAIGTQLRAGAITNRPFLKDLPPIEISAGDYQPLLEAVALSESKRVLAIDPGKVPGKPNPERPTKGNAMKNFKLKKLTEGENKGKVGVFEGEDMVGLAEMFPGDENDPDHDEKMREVQLREQNEKNDAAFLGEVAKAKPGEILVLGEKRSSEGKLSMAGFLRAQKVAALVDGAVKDGKLLPAQREHFFALASANYDAAAACLSMQKPAVDTRERGLAGNGNEGATAAEKLNASVTALMSEKKLNRPAALREFARQNPEMWEEYKRETMAGASSER